MFCFRRAIPLGEHQHLTEGGHQGQLLPGPRWGIWQSGEELDPLCKVRDRFQIGRSLDSILAGLPQVLHLLNAPQIHAKLSHAGGRVAQLVRQLRDDGALVDELYLTFYSRVPTADEKAVALHHLGGDRAKRQKAAEDLAWALMNSLEFVFNH